MRLERGEVRGQVLPCSQPVRINLQELQTADQPARITIMLQVQCSDCLITFIERKSPATAMQVASPGIRWRRRAARRQYQVTITMRKYAVIRQEAFYHQEIKRVQTRNIQVNTLAMFNWSLSACLVSPWPDVVKGNTQNQHLLHKLAFRRRKQSEQGTIIIMGLGQHKLHKLIIFSGRLS